MDKIKKEVDSCKNVIKSQGGEVFYFQNFSNFKSYRQVLNCLIQNLQEAKIMLIFYPISIRIMIKQPLIKDLTILKTSLKNL